MSLPPKLQIRACGVLVSAEGALAILAALIIIITLIVSHRF